MSYLHFLETSSLSGKTKEVLVSNQETGLALGTIKWWGAWRRYVFAPNFDCVYDKNCLNEVISKIDALMAERT